MTGQRPPSRRKRTYRPGTQSRWASVRKTLTSREGRRGVIATAAVGALVAAVVTPLVTTQATAAPADVVVLSENFDGQSLGRLQKNDNPTVTFVAAGSGYAAQVADRTQSHFSVAAPAGTLEPGVQYSFSAKVKLVTAAEGVSAHFTAGPDYKWVANTPVNASTWTTLTGTYTLPADAQAKDARFYVELAKTADGAAVLDAFQLDDVVVTRPAPADAPVLSENFDGQSLGRLQKNDNPTVTFVAAGSGYAAQVADRTQSHFSVAAPAGTLEPGVQYSFSAKVKLVTAAEGVSAHFTAGPDYKWVANTPVNASTWTTLTGTYTLPADAQAKDARFYVELAKTADGAAVLDAFQLDDVVVTKVPSTGGGGDPTPSVVPGGAVNPTTAQVTTARGAGNVAALTFDDGPNDAATTELLDFLKANDVTATFCVIGQNARTTAGAALVKRMVAEGHTLCNHSTGYEALDSLSVAEAEKVLAENLRIIREAAGDPNLPVPYFRAPNGAWGNTPAAAVKLGMQPLGLGNMINDWGTQPSVDVLAERLRTAIAPGAVVLVHDGGGNRDNGIDAVKQVVAERLAADWTFTLPQGGAAEAPAGALIKADFEDRTLQGWSARADGKGSPTVAVVEGGHAGGYAARISGRTSQGQGLQYPVTGVLTPGVTYEVEAWIKFEDTPGDITLSYRSESGGTSSYGGLVALPGATTEWTRVSGTFSVPTNTQEIYFETAYANGAAGNTSTFLVDDIAVRIPAEPEIQDLTPLKSTVEFPLGVAVDPRETMGASSELTTLHFNQLSPENHMKPYAWYGADRSFRLPAEADEILRFAQDEQMRVYGHVLVWHSQNPGQDNADATGWTSWFFQDEQGNPLPTDGSARELMLDRMETHINSVAKAISDEYGRFGSATNPIKAWDVINEVVSDTGESSDGLRRSAWYQTVGPDFIDWSFRYADKAFNETYAAPGTDRPVKLFINDYNTEQSGKQQRYLDLVERLVAADVPIDGVGHQMHVSLAMPVSALEGAITRFEHLGLLQAVTELDVTTGLPVTDAKLIDQGYYYRDAFEVFRRHADELFSVTIWGLTDARSWRDEQDPLLFDRGLQAKPAYYGAVGDELPAPVRTATVFAGDVPLEDGATDALAWDQLPLVPVGDDAGFQLRWAADHLTAYVTVADATVEDGDAVELQLGDDTYRIGRDGEGDLASVVSDGAEGYALVVHLPAEGLTTASHPELDVRVVDGGTTVGWNAPGALGSLTLVEELSYLEVAQAASAPTVDGAVDEAWQSASVVTTDKVVSGGGATAEVRTLWRDDTLYVLADVTDPSVDVSATSPWEQDSVEVFVDAGNHKNGSFRPDDTQIRVSAANAVSYGTGNENDQKARIRTATARTDTGYRVELAVNLLDESGAGTFHGLDFQVNDATNGGRTSIRTWADPTGNGYQTTSRWGVGQLVTDEPGGNPGEKPDGKPTITLGAAQVRAGGQVDVKLAGFEAGQKVAVSLGAGATGRQGAAVAVPAGSTALGTVTVAADGTATLRVTVPAATQPGVYLLQASDGSTVLASTSLTVLAAQAGGAAGPGGLAVTGTGIGIGVLALLVLAAGVALVVARKRGLLTRP